MLITIFLCSLFMSTSTNIKVPLTNNERKFIIPSIIPDEFYLGYLGRFSKINCYTNSIELKRKLNIWMSHEMPEIISPPFTFTFANYINIELKTFLKQHTLLPILRATKTGVKNEKLLNEAMNTSDFGELKKLSYGLAKKNAFFCKCCIKEDEDYLSFSFWRRSHQLPGIDWCSKHNKPLQEVFVEDAFSKQPYTFLKSGNYINVKDTLSKNNPTILRFAQLLDDALTLDHSIDTKVVRDALQTKAKQFGIKFSETQSSKQLSDEMIEVLPSAWLEKYFPRLKKEYYGQYVSGFDEVLKPSDKGKSCVNSMLAAATLFENPDDAMLALAANKQFPINKPEISDITFIHSYIRNCGSYLKIGHELNKDRRYIFGRAQNLGLPSLSGVDAVTIKAIEEFFMGADMGRILLIPNIDWEKFGNIIRISGRRFSSTIKKMNKIK